MSRFKKVLMGGEWEPQFWNARLSLDDACDRYAEHAKAAGLTSIQINFIPDPYHPLLFTYPGEVYLYFGNYAASLDMFADSTYSRGIYPPFMLQANLARLKALSQAAARHGLSALLYVGEPRFVHPELFRRFPTWRGPRVDNPAASMNPLYALDTDRDDVLDHYKQMMETVTAAAPNLTDLVLFCHDSGAGFSHSYALYAGPNGPFYNSTFFNRPANLGKRVVRFCKALRDAALPRCPDFEVGVTSQFTPEERADIQRHASDGIHLLVWGEDSRTGGLEDQYAWYQAGVEQLTANGFDAARQQRWARFKERVDLATTAGRSPRIVTSAPNESYLPFHYMPNPWEFLSILEQSDQWGADALMLKGWLCSEQTRPFNVNEAAIKLFLNDRSLSIDSAIENALASMVPVPAIDAMLKALRHIEQAVRFRPLYSLYITRDVTFLPGPLVPDPSKLSRDEKSYYWTDAHDTLARIKGDFFFIPDCSKQQLNYFFAELDRRTMPALDAALAALRDAEQSCAGDDRALACVAVHRRLTNLFRCMMTSIRHYAGMSVHWRAIRGIEVPSPAQLVEAECHNTRVWIEHLSPDAAAWIRLAAFDGTIYGPSASFLQHLSRRIEVMQNHRHDASRAFGIEHDRPKES